MRLKATHLLITAALGAAIVSLSPQVNARNAYRLQAQTQFKLVGSDGKGEIACTYCHINTFGGQGWNKFGTAVHDLFFGTAKNDISQALYLTLKANKDSDGDGFTDVLEVVAKTLPGDPTSKPTKTAAVLTAALKKMGGVDAFKPKP